MKRIFFLTSILLSTSLIACQQQQQEKKVLEPVRTLTLSIALDNDLAIEEWLKSAIEEFKKQTNILPTGTKLEFSLIQESTVSSMEKIASGKEKIDAVLLPHPGFAQIINGQIKNLGAPVSSCKELIASPYVAVIPKKQSQDLNRLLGRQIPEFESAPIPIKLKELYEILNASRFGYTHPGRSARGQFAMLLSIAANSEQSSSQTIDWRSLDQGSKKLQEHLEWYATSDVQLLKRIASLQAKSGRSLNSDFNLGIISLRQLQSYNQLKDSYSVLLPSDGSIWESHSLCLSEADWINPQKRAILVKFQEFLSSQAIIESAQERGFLSAENILNDNQAKELALPKALEFSQDKSELSRSFADQRIKPYSISFSIDTSATMGPETVSQLREYAQKLIQSPKAQKVDLISFSSEIQFLGNKESPSSTLQSRLNALSPSGGSALYDAIAKQYEILSKNPIENSRRVALIVTDGNDKNSQRSVEELVEILSDSERSKGFISLHLVLVSPAEADKEPLIKITEAGNGNLYETERDRLVELLAEIEAAL